MQSKAEPAVADVAGLVVDGLATYRLVKLVRQDKIAEPLRDAVEERHGPPDASMLSYLMGCPWCLSVYFGVGLALGRRFLPGPTAVAARGLALSAMAGLASQRFD